MLRVRGQFAIETPLTPEESSQNPADSSKSTTGTGAAPAPSAGVPEGVPDIAGRTGLEG